MPENFASPARCYTIPSNQIQKIEKVKLSKIISDSITVYDEIVGKKALSIQQKIAVDFVYGDASMTKSIIRNLIDNAAKNTASGSITIVAKIAGDACEITITDKGKGLTEEQLAEMNRYFKSDQEILSFSSSQFGYKVIKDFSRKLTGTIRYQHKSPAGITVIVTLPLEAEPL